MQGHWSCRASTQALSATITDFEEKGKQSWGAPWAGQSDYPQRMESAFGTRKEWKDTYKTLKEGNT